MEHSKLSFKSTVSCLILLASSGFYGRTPSIELNPSPDPTWVEQGPGPLVGGQPRHVPGSPNPGAIEVVVPHPTNVDIAFVGTVGGGIWRTSNLTASDPNGPVWTPLTDSLPSLSIGSLAFSPLDHHTLYAGTGSYTSGTLGLDGGTNGGAAIGVLKSTDDGNHWSVLGGETFAGLKIRRILPTQLTSGGGKTVLADGGVGGVFATPTSRGGPNIIWSRFGTGLANANVHDIHYDARDDVLIAGTFGRGTWAISRASTFLPAKSLTRKSILVR